MSFYPSAGNNNVSILLTDESQPDVLKTCATSLAILGSVCFLISIFVGIIAGVILMCLCTSHKATQVSTPLYDYVGEPEKTDIATEQNKSYGCAPKLPKPRITSTSDRQRSSTNRSQ